MPVELWHAWVLENFNNQKPEFYARWFDESEEGSFEVPPGWTKVGLIRKTVPDAPKLYVFQDSKDVFRDFFNYLLVQPDTFIPFWGSHFL